MNFTEEFIKDVLSLITNEKEQYDVLSGKKSIGDFLRKQAFKGIDSKVVLNCIEQHDLDLLRDLARKQERIDAYYNEWIEYYVLRKGMTFKQRVINAEVPQMFGYNNWDLKLTYPQNNLDEDNVLSRSLTNKKTSLND